MLNNLSTIQDPQQLPQETQDLTPPQQEDTQPVSILDQIDKDDLSTYILNLLRDDMADKEQMDWKNRRQYDVNAYYGIKQPTTFPWKNASNFPVPLTATLLDTAHSNILGSIFADPQQTIEVEGVGPEDIKKAPDLKAVLNWQMYYEIDGYSIMDKTTFRSLFCGVGVIKLIQSVFEKKMTLASIPAEDVYLPIDAKGFQKNETDHVIQIVALTPNDIEQRKAMGVYEGIEDIPKGFNVRHGSLADIVTIAKDVASGIRLDQRNRRDLHFIMEVYLTYYWKPQNAPEAQPKQSIELLVTMAPNGGKILRMVENKLGLRPFVEFIPYPRDDRFWGESLPERIRHIQEELDYAHNQNINAADIAILPPMFFRQGSDFDPELHKRVAGGAYPIPDPRDVTFQNIPVNPIFERQEDRYWDLAERLTGLTELFQGRSPAGRQTATLTIHRENRSEIRFKTLYQRYEVGWNKLVNLIYLYDREYLDPQKMIKVIGVTESFRRINDLFPQGLDGNYNFKFCASPLTEKEYKKNSKVQLYQALIVNPLVLNNAGNLWRTTKMLSEALGERDLEEIVTKPREANIASAEEAIQRIMGGEVDFVPDPGIDENNYLLRLSLFFKTDSFKTAEPAKKQALILLYRRSDIIRQGKIVAMMDKNILTQPQGGMNGPEGQNKNGGSPTQDGGMAEANGIRTQPTN